ncbi:MAG: hypothetical protein HN576_03140 [Bacteriovoracaceae bacterium]|jgi:carbamoyltransferase|nr:hypothetical protein [Bacteriovoracaceae bacterium]
MKTFTGLAKTIYNSNVCAISSYNGSISDITILSTERLTRKKYAGNWPFLPLELLCNTRDLGEEIICENRDVTTPKDHEESMDLTFPFYNYLGTKKLTRYSSVYNNKLKFIGHHDAHAYCALAMSPFKKSLILVVDGSGSRKSDVIEEIEAPKNKKYQHESVSVYTQNLGEIKCVNKEWQEFQASKSCMNEYFSDSIGIFYENIARFVFGSKMASGKLMGLSAFGNPMIVKDRINFLENLDWSKSFSKSDNVSWDKSENLNLYMDLAATAQNEYSKYMKRKFNDLKLSFSDYENIIFTGGCALNCSNNFELINQKTFKQIYVPPFPGDEGLSLGLSYFTYLKDKRSTWKVIAKKAQHSYYGSSLSIPTGHEITTIFNKYKVTKLENISKEVSILLNKNNIVAWFQGRSECGQRALGHRSLLASLSFPKLKNYLNSKVKFREEFRPYGGACLAEKVHLYFNVEKYFLNPFMSFTLPINEKFSNQLKEITHKDKTSRVQTVHFESNEKFYNLIKYYGNLSGIYCILNTSLNTMGEPIVEDINDVYNFFEKSPLKFLAIEDYLIEKI